jgi:uncharacterized membrane protein
MQWWGAVWGAILGAMWPGNNEEIRLFFGAFLGFWAGFSLKWVVRSQIEQLLDEQSKKARAATHAASSSTDESTSKPSATAVVRPASTATPSSSTLPTPVQTVKTATENADESLWSSETEAHSGLRASAAASAATESVKAMQPVAPPPSRTPSQPAAKPTGPGALERGMQAIQAWFMGGNTIVRVGLVILFIGLSFLARYAASAGLLPVELRLAFIGAVGIAMLVVGFRKREAKPGFALALQGAGVAVLYLTVFAAFRLYNLLPMLAAFGLMIVVCALSCALALLQNSRALAFAAFAGGFASPILLSTGQGNHVGLFSYYAVLNLAILFIAHQRSWRVLNLLGFCATFIVAGAWGVLKYLPEQYGSAQPFLIGFVLIYVFTAILYARNTPTKLGNAVDSTLVFGTPLIGFGLQAGLVRHIEWGLAFSALGFAFTYIVLATLLVRRAKDNYRLLIECFIALGVGFATLAVPLALDARWTSLVWALEGLGAFWVGMRQARWMPRAFGLLLQGVAMMGYLNGLGSNAHVMPLLNPAFMGAVVLAVSSFILAGWLRQPLAHSGSVWAKQYETFERLLPAPSYLLAFALWWLAWGLEFTRTLPSADSLAYNHQSAYSEDWRGLLIMMAFLLSASLSMAIARRKQWAVASWPALFCLPVMGVTWLFQIIFGNHVLHTPGWLIWPAALLIHYLLLKQHESGLVTAFQGLLTARHVVSVWFVTLLLADCLWLAIDNAQLWHTSWASVVLLVSAIAILMLLTLWAGKANSPQGLQTKSWPLQPHARAYFWTAALPLAGLVYLLALIAAVTSSGRTQPLPFVPLLNPTELSIALAIGALLIWRRVVMTSQPLIPNALYLGSPAELTALAGLVFIAINSVWLRIAHHYFGVSWDAGALFNSFVVQTGYAILWTLIALGCMLVAHRRVQRTLWLIGAALLGVVVLKLMTIDLSNVGGAERIITFIGVGVLMLVVGYVAPLPPKTAIATPSAETSPT